MHVFMDLVSCSPLRDQRRNPVTFVFVGLAFIGSHYNLPWLASASASQMCQRMTRESFKNFTVGVRSFIRGGPSDYT